MSRPLAKPADGARCNGCGVCCIMSVCCLPEIFGLAIAEESEGPCPILEQADGRYWCGFVRSPSRHLKLKDGTDPEAVGAEIRSWLGDGSCDSSMPEGAEPSTILLALRLRRGLLG